MGRMNSAYDDLSEHIYHRAQRKKLSVSMENMQYAHSLMFRPVSDRHFRNALYVGVGHGHDAILTLLNNRAEAVIGVDPFLKEDGNDDEDYLSLLNLIEEMKLKDRFDLRRTTIEEFLTSCRSQFDLIVASDVFHHIFVTRRKLSRDFGVAAQLNTLCSDLFGVARDEGVLLVSEVERHGIRPILNKLGLHKTNVGFSTKQSAGQWRRGIESSGWNSTGIGNYVPHRLRRWFFLKWGLLPRMTVCNRYHLYFRK